MLQQGPPRRGKAGPVPPDAIPCDQVRQVGDRQITREERRHSAFEQGKLDRQCPSYHLRGGLGAVHERGDLPGALEWATVGVEHCIQRDDDAELQLLLRLRFRIRVDLGLDEDDYDKMLDETPG